MSEINVNRFVPLVPFMPKDPQFGNAYVPYQIDFKIVDQPREALRMGTAFPDLYNPYKESDSLW